MSQAPIKVSAAKHVKLNLPTNDLVKVQKPEIVDLGTEIVNGKMSKARNSSNLNMDVSTGMHYEHIDDTSKKLYRAIAAASGNVIPYESQVNVNTSGVVPVVKDDDSYFDFTQEQFQDAYEAVRYDFPELIQLTLCDINFFESSKTNQSQTVYSSYVYLKSRSSSYNQSKFDQMTQELKAKRTEILSNVKVTGAQGLLAKELAIHDLLLDINVYDDTAAVTGGAYHLCHTAYGALVKGTSVCDGYAIALEYLLDGIDVDSLVISGMADGGGHAWNIVKAGGEWYEVDATWNDYESTNGDPEAFLQAIMHEYYHLTTADISNHTTDIQVGNRSVGPSTHTRSRDGFSLSLPIATSTKYSYENVLKAISEGDDIQNVPITELTLSPMKIEGPVGITDKFTVTITPDNATNKTLIWSSSNESVITVDQEGNYETVGAGKATVTVKSLDGMVSATAEIIIEDENSSGQGGSGDSGSGDSDQSGSGGSSSDDNGSQGGSGGSSQGGSYSDDNNQGDSGNSGNGQSDSGSGGSSYSGDSATNDQSDDTFTPKPYIENENTPASEGTVISASDSGTNGNYKVTSSDEEYAAVTYTGAANKSAKSVTIPSSITDSNGVVYKVTAIGDGAFSKNTGIRTVTIPSSVKVISRNAFNGCKNLKSIKVNGNTLTTVKSGAFKGIRKNAKFTVVAKSRKIYNNIVKKLKKAGAKKATFKFKKG